MGFLYLMCDIFVLSFALVFTLFITFVFCVIAVLPFLIPLFILWLIFAR